MPRDGTKNLIPLTKRSKEEQKKIRRAAGIKSGESRRKKRLLRDTLESYLYSKSSHGKTYEDEIILALIKSAQEGDTKAFEVIRDTIGQKPADKLEAKVDMPVFLNVNNLDE